MKYIPLFILIQLVNLPLMIVGFFIVPYDVIFNKPVPYIWENMDDTPQPAWSKGRTIVWLAFRNPVANLRYIKGVSKTGRPLFYRTWFWTVGSWKKQFYIKLGWMSNGYPACSSGAGRGY